MHYIKQIFSDDIEDWVHRLFVKYGRGEYQGPRIRIACAGKYVKVSATYDYATALCEVLAKNFGGELSVSGKIISREKIEDLVSDFLKIKKSKGKKGVFELEVAGDVDAQALVGIIAASPGTFFLLNLTSGKNKIKSKNKLPKPGSKLKEGFVTASYDAGILPTISDEFLFDVEGDFTEASISHTYKIDELVKPEGVDDPARIRVESKRKGKVIREVSVDGVDKKCEHSLLI